MPTNEQREIDARLRSLKKELDRNEELMKQAAISYEDLMAERDSLRSTLEDLKKSRKEIRQQDLSSV
jgi:hypothetical protein